jgi:hypothetical protein
MRHLATLTKDDIRSLEIAGNKTACARQALRPDAVPSYAPKAAADRYFREAIFAYADARYLRDSFWRDMAGRYGVPKEDTGRMYVDFNTKELSLRD